MSIKHAILGYLSWQSFSGYDLKKLIADSAAFYWSGNNNQIYKTLVQLAEEGLVTSQVIIQEDAPNKKIYTITAQGRAELHNWVNSTPELPEMRSTFLIQLAWADLLTPTELDRLLGRYEDEIQSLALVHAEKIRRGIPAPGRSPREHYLWSQIAENLRLSYEKELDWVRRLRTELSNNPALQ